MCKNNAMPKMPSSKVRAWEQVKGQEWELEVTMVECHAYGDRENYFSHPQVLCNTGNKIHIKVVVQLHEHYY